jgi:hypothetical protein
MTDIKTKLREGLMNNPTVANIWDFDGTLVDTGLPETHKPIWKAKTGTEWPHKGWWGRVESLDPLFNHQAIASVKSDYNQHKGDGLNIMLTGRRSKLASAVEDILAKNGYEMDKYWYNYGSDTLSNKIEQMGNLLKEYPTVKVINMWEDRTEHIPTFKQWLEGLVEKGRLDSYNITHVPSPNHG